MRFLARSVIPALAAAVALAGCSSSTEAPSPAPAASDSAPAPSAAAEMLQQHGLEGLGAVELIDRLDRTAVTERPDGLIASVRPHSLVLSNGQEGQEQEVTIPDDRFYLSIAPYVNQTHECYFHSLTTCLGELRNEPVTVKVTEKGTGKVLADESTTTFDNGFVAVWLPRDISATVTVGHKGRSATAAVATGPEDLTCLTTMRLA